MLLRRIARVALALGVLCPAAFGQGLQASAVPAQTGILPVHALKVGTTFSAAIDYRNESRSDLNPLMDDIQSSADGAASSVQQGLSRSLEIRISGEMEVSVIGHDGEEQLARLRMPAADAVLLSDGASAGIEAASISSCLADGVVFATSAQGRITKVWIKPECGAISAGAVRTLLALLQFVGPKSGEKAPDAWEVNEEDQTGTYAVRYSKQARAEGTFMFRKEKIRFLPPRAKRRETRRVVLPVTYQPQGGMNVGFDPATGQLISIEASESYAIVINGKNVGSSSTSFSLKRTGLSAMSAAKQKSLLKGHEAAARALRATSLWVPQTNAERDTLLYRQKLGGETVSSLLAQLSVAEKAGDRDTNSTELYQKFKALIYLHPESCQKLAKTAAAGKPDGLASRLLVRALATVGSPPAQEAIVSVMHSRAADTDFVMAVIPVLGMFEEPAANTEAVLKGLAYHSKDDDVAFTAQLALGAMADNLAEHDPARARRIVEEFMSKYPAPAEARDISRVILMLGNARMEEYLPTLNMYAEHPMPEARSETAYVLRFYSGETVENILIRSLTHDQDNTTRREAAASLGFMGGSDRVVAALKRAYADEKIDKIRIEILKSLWKSARQHPEIRQIMEQAAEKDESEEVKKTAHGILGEHQEK